jgi:hypothetical protein
MRTTTERLEPQLSHFAGRRALQVDDLYPPGLCAYHHGPMMHERCADIHANANFYGFSSAVLCMIACVKANSPMCQALAGKWSIIVDIHTRQFGTLVWWRACIANG